MDKSVNILLVEDDEVDVMAVKRAFDSLKVANSLFHARDGREALCYLRGEDGYQAIGRPYLILLDLRMPRMDGLEFLEILRGDPQHRDAVVFVLTTSDQDADRAGAYRHNVAGYIVKSRVKEHFMDAVGLIEHYWRIVEFP